MLALVFVFLFQNPTELYVIVEKPQLLNIVDRFKNVVDAKIMSSFGSFTPFRVIERNLTFDDGLTNAMRVEFQNSEFYILKDAEGAMLNYKNAGKIELLKQSSKDGKHYFLTKSLQLKLQDDSIEKITEATVLKAVFRHGRRAYIKSSSGKYAWVSLKSLVELKGKEEFNDRVFTDLKQHISRTNEKLDKLFLAVNKKFKRDLLNKKIRLIKGENSFKIISPLSSNKALFESIRKNVFVDNIKFLETDSSLTVSF